MIGLLLTRPDGKEVVKRDDSLVRYDAVLRSCTHQGQHEGLQQMTSFGRCLTHGNEKVS